MKTYFDFIMYLAFETLLSFENKRSITIEKLHNYRIALCKKHLEYHSQFIEYDDEDFERALHSFHELNLNMKEEEEKQNFIDFINNNNEFFFYQNGTINLKENITFEMIEDEKTKVHSYKDKTDMIICGELIRYKDCIECQDILELKKIKNVVYELVKDEKQIEKSYGKSKEKELDQNLEKIISHNNLKLAIIGHLKENMLSNYHRTISHFEEIDPEAKGEDIWLLSNTFMENDKFYNLNRRHLELTLSNKYQRAIFDTGILAYDRLGNIMKAIWTFRQPNAQIELEPVDEEAMFSLLEDRMKQSEEYTDEFDDEEETDFDDYDEEDYMDQVEWYIYLKNIEMAFYLNYINHINEFLSIYGNDETLENSKTRLLYLLDNYNNDIYKEENFQKALNDISLEKFDYKEDFDDFYELSRMFLVDIFEGWINDNMTSRKMLFVSTYYDLTKDRRIKRIIAKYNKTEMCKKISEIIFNHNYSELNLGLTETPKKLIKKKTDNKNELKN